MSEVTTKASPNATVPAVPPATSTTQQSKKKAPGLTFRRFFTKVGVNPYDEVEWEKRLAQITDWHNLRAEGRRSSQRLVDDRHQHRGFKVPAWTAWHARS